MHRTRETPFGPSDPRHRDTLPDLRRRQSRAIQTACCRHSKRAAIKQLCGAPRADPLGQGEHTWLPPSGISRARTFHETLPDGSNAFGQGRRLIERVRGMAMEREWKAKRFWPLVIEDGHARQFGRQGSSHLLPSAQPKGCLLSRARTRRTASPCQGRLPEAVPVVGYRKRCGRGAKRFETRRSPVRLAGTASESVGTHESPISRCGSQGGPFR
jgi:hypothetical protein